LHLTEPCRALGYRAGQFPLAEQASRELLALPMYPEMTLQQQNVVIKALAECFVNRS